MRRSSYKRKSVRQHLLDESRHEPDLEFWLEHIVHWHALLLASVAMVTFGYIFSFN